MWANHGAHAVRKIVRMVHKTLIGKVLSKIMLDNANKSLTMKTSTTNPEQTT